MICDSPKFSGEKLFKKHIASSDMDEIADFLDICILNKHCLNLYE